MASDLIEFVQKMGRPRIGVVGDLMLDEYVWGEVERISPEAPIPVLRVSRREVRVGGGGSVAVNLARLGVDVRVFGIVGADAPGERVRTILEDEGCDTGGVLPEEGRRTTVKARHVGFVQQAHRAVQQILRVDDEEIQPLAPENLERLLSRLAQTVGELDAILISDYDKGLVVPGLIQGIQRLGAAVPLLVDPARINDYSLYRGAFLICPNRFEAQRATGISCREIESCRAAGMRLLRDLRLQAAAITLDREGIYLCTRDGECRHFPTRARVVSDVTGAGDMVLSVLGLVTAVGGSLERAVELANVAAGIEVRHVGVKPISRRELLQDLQFQGHPVVQKVKPIAELEAVVRAEAESGKSIVFTNGCFDLLHLGHHRLLEAARREGDVLVVAVNSDASIRRLKGPHRPRIPEDDRVLMLAGLEFVDYVTVFDDDTPHRLLEALRPHVLVKGAEYRDGVVEGREIVEGYGGRVAYVDMVAGISTTELLRSEGRSDPGPEPPV